MNQNTELPPKERAARYRAMAHDAMRNADRFSSARMKEGYRLMAKAWLRLADEAEALDHKLRNLRA